MTKKLIALLLLCMPVSSLPTTPMIRAALRRQARKEMVEKLRCVAREAPFNAVKVAETVWWAYVGAAGGAVVFAAPVVLVEAALNEPYLSANPQFLFKNSMRGGAVIGALLAGGTPGALGVATVLAAGAYQSKMKEKLQQEEEEREC